jgi:SRSO17 transposase
MPFFWPHLWLDNGIDRGFVWIDRSNHQFWAQRCKPLVELLYGSIYTGSLVEGIADAFGTVLERYRSFFATRGRSNGAVAQRYLRGLTQAETCTFEAMASVVEDSCAQQFQHFISNSPWPHEPVVAQIREDAGQLLGGQADSCLILDETSFPKQGNRSVGVARQWSGRLGKIDNCQVAVFCVLSNGQQHAPIDMRLYLPKAWIEDGARCELAGVPAAARQLVSKSQHALAMVRAARASGMGFGWVGADAGYGKEPAFLRALADEGELFVADVHRTQRVWIEDPGLHVPAAPMGRGRPSIKLQAGTAPIEVQELIKGFGPQDWTRCVLRDSTRGPLRVDMAHRRVFVWDGEESQARCWHLVVRREVGSPKTVKYSLSNAPVDTPLLRLAQMQGHRYWVERTFQDAKGQCGLADYQALGWQAWHHHVTMVMLAMLFMAQQRLVHNPGLDLLSPRDIVEMLKETLPSKPESKEALVRRINERHKRRRGAIQSRFQAAKRPQPP